ncbi:serine/threonine-protein kinase [Fuerstiella marisgermanici]|uniref:non-specific serine/threonine protein kinase n=1 Tax=Fuerstiella marisgermanici TaxID=1891926 RepID=A0A1P8WEY1_9PLAN|nr:serine/threonine-protein kinase [Fuerstiella marisgermanici]APZ92600.1 Serine/threonine-protein kinase PknB [Fuerstiella marisgermanici]
MNQDDIFLKASEITDAAERAAYVNDVCAGNAELEQRVTALLKADEEASRFLDTPAMSDVRAQVRELREGSNDPAVDGELAGPSDETTIEQCAVPNQNAADEVEDEFRRHLLPGTRAGWLGRLGHYEIEEILGHGAFGVVAKAFDEKLHRVVAIKMLRPELATTSPPRKRFLREARTAAAITHENVVGIYAVEEEPVPYIAMEYVPGPTLQARLNEQGPLEVQEVLRIAMQIAQGLSAAHKVKLIHRDIKPGNVLLACDPADRVKISDFGLARAVDDASLTSSGVIAGTPLYMAPEQARGEKLDHRADLFSLGSVMYQMVSGRPPFRAANTIAVLKRVCEDTPRDIQDVIPDTPLWLCAIIVRLLEKNPDNRYQSADQVAELLTRCQQELQANEVVTCVPGAKRTPAKSSDSTRSAERIPLRKPAVGWLAALLTIAAIIPLTYKAFKAESTTSSTMSTDATVPDREQVTDVSGTSNHSTPSDQDIIDFIRSTGGRLTLGEPPLAGTSLTAMKNPQPLSTSVAHFDFRRSKLNIAKVFGDEQLKQFAEQMKGRPDIKVGVLNLAGTEITNAGLLTLKELPIEELLLSSTKVECDKIADELSRFPVQDWDFGDRLSSKGLSRFSSNPHVRGLSLDSKVIGTQSLSLFVNSDLRRLQIYGRNNRPLPMADQFRRIPKLTDLYLPGWLHLPEGNMSKQQLSELRRVLSKTTVHTANYYDRLPSPPEYPETDFEILSLVESVGGRINQYRNGGLVELQRGDNPSLSAGTININLWNKPEFTDSMMERLTTLLKQRPDVDVLCFQFPGTPITNKGLRYLKGMRLGQIMARDTAIDCDLIADELSEFSFRKWDLTPQLNEAGLLAYLEKLRTGDVLTIRPEQVSPSFAVRLSDSKVRHLVIQGSTAAELPKIDVLTKLTNLSDLTFDFVDDIPPAYLRELRERMPLLGTRHNDQFTRPDINAVRSKLKEGMILAHGRNVPLAAEVPASYRLEFSARRVSGENGVGVMFQIGQNSGVVTFSGWGESGGMTGLALVDGVNVPDSPDMIAGDLFADGKDHRIMLRVTPTTVNATVDKMALIQWDGDPSLLTPFGYLKGNPTPLYLLTHSDFFISDLRFEAIDTVEGKELEN